jgi:hypothetical protein
VQETQSQGPGHIVIRKGNLTARSLSRSSSIPTLAENRTGASSSLLHNGSSKDRSQECSGNCSKGAKSQLHCDTRSRRVRSGKVKSKGGLTAVLRRGYLLQAERRPFIDEVSRPSAHCHNNADSIQAVLLSHPEHRMSPRGHEQPVRAPRD